MRDLILTVDLEMNGPGRLMADGGGTTPARGGAAPAHRRRAPPVLWCSKHGWVKLKMKRGMW
jgi:hypothetical protein